MKLPLVLFSLLVGLLANAQTDIPARFPGGNNAYNLFMSQHLKYPTSALESKADRTIKVLVRIDSIGRPSIQEFIYENSGLGFEDEVESFINQMPNWIPAMYNNIPSSSQIILSFDFKYQHEQEGPAEGYKVTFYEVSDIPPFYTYGHDSLVKRMQVLLVDSLKLRNVSGSCTIQFIVDTTGRLLNVSILENKTGTSDRYMQYVLDKAGGWHPGLIRGRKVGVQITQTFLFR
ncbi:MAG: hypothetical protein H6608_09840 [Flavobacteriales bacterium]|nr:hypothetical protein [Bacteroidota bacterium]MCB9241423.1 hypothetical protein [Flavobacteriales bacterium]